MHHLRMKRIAALAAAPVLLLAGCSGSSSPPALSAATTSARSTGSPAASSATGKADVVHPLGASVHENYFRAKVISFRPTVKLAGPPDDPDSHWAAAEVKFCWTDPAKDAPGGVTVSWEPWSLLDGSSHRFSAFSTGSGYDWKSPVYPDGSDQGTSALKLGDCVSGWIEFPVANGAKITQVRYSPEGDPTITWRI